MRLRLVDAAGVDVLNRFSLRGPATTKREAVQDVRDAAGVRRL